MSLSVFDIAQGVQGYYIKNDRFNTTTLSYNFYLPLNSKTMAKNALLPYLLSSCSKNYPDYINLNIRLLELYGADLCCSVAKCGNYQNIKISINVINNNLSFDGTNPVNQAAELLAGLIFNPALENGGFTEFDTEREKRKTIERIQGEINNKKAFAKTRLMEEMFKDDPYGKFRYGSVEEVEQINGKNLYAAYKELLETAYIRINVIGRELPNGVFDIAKEQFANINRNPITNLSHFVSLPENETPNTVIERLNITQGKLALGFTSKEHGSVQKTAALSLFADIFGGGPYSKLFENVREKQSLCYYCSATTGRNKGFVMVQSGVEEENADKALASIMKEFADMQNGNFDQSVIDSSKKSMVDALNGYYDSATALDLWYSLDMEDVISPLEAVEFINRVTKEEIVAAAKGVKLHTVYKLLPKEAE